MAQQDEQDLSDTQRDTAALLSRLLGQTFSDRYVDFCRLASGNLSLRVSVPLAAHALREFESSLTKALDLPGTTQPITVPTEEASLLLAERALREVGFDESATRRALKALPVPRGHKTKVLRILDWLGLPRDGDIAKAWIALGKEGHSKAHQRSFHQSLPVDEAFRVALQQPFEFVVREVMLALEHRYRALMLRVEELAAMPDRKKAVDLFKQEIPGALPLQWHFFQRLQTPDWLPCLAEEKLLSTPLTKLAAQFPFGAWPAGNYLLRMAESPDPQTRQRVVTALRNVEDFSHPDMRYTGIEILSALPPGEAAPFAAMVATWLDRDARFMLMQAPERLMTRLAEGHHPEAALDIARTLLQVFEEDGNIATLYARSMYEYTLPGLVQVLARTCGLGALTLFVDLLRQAAFADGKVTEHPFADHSEYTLRPVDDDEFAAHDTYSALITAVRTCAEMLVQADPASMQPIIATLTDTSLKVGKRIALHVLAKNPGGAPDLAQAWLTDVHLIDSSWCKDEYAALARVWYPSLPANLQEAIVDAVRAIPDRYRDGWKAQREQQGQPISHEDECAFDAIAIRDSLWGWREVLPEALQAELAESSQKYGDPDAWKNVSVFHPEESPMRAADLSALPLDDLLIFLRTWCPPTEQRWMTVSALAHQLRIAVQQEPARYADAANQFADLAPIYIQSLLEGLDNSPKNQRDFAWTSVLELTTAVFGHLHEPIGQPDRPEQHDSDWLAVCQTAGGLLRSGLGRGAESIDYEHATSIQALVFTLLREAPHSPELDDFEERFGRDAFLAAQASLRGSAVETGMLWLFWLSKHAASPISITQRTAMTTLTDLAGAFLTQLADRSLSGRIPRAILGRYLTWLLHFGADWTYTHIYPIFADTDEPLRQAAWSAFLLHGSHPVREPFPELLACYRVEMTSLTECTESDKIDYRQKRLAEQLLTLYLNGSISLAEDDLFAHFLRLAPSSLRQHVMWYVGRHLLLSPDQFPQEHRNRALAYWTARLTAATIALDPGAFREELETIGQWVSNPQLETSWLFEQLLTMLHAGFVPGLTFNVVDWLSKVCALDIDRAMQILAALVDNPREKPVTYLAQHDAIRKILVEALASPSAHTIELANKTISILSTRGETSYLSLGR